MFSIDRRNHCLKDEALWTWDIGEELGVRIIIRQTRTGEN